MDGHNLTICSVSFNSTEYLGWNWQLARHLNPSEHFTWVVIENTPLGSDGRVDAQSGHFLVANGYEFDLSRPRPASYHHGVALNKALGLVNTRFVLILDPDFYILRRNWVAEVIQHMQANGLAFFGAPWHPKWYIKYRYFPCAHCMFIDLARVSIDGLDFRPGQPARKAHVFSAFPKRWIPPFVRRAGRLGLRVVYNLRRREVIGSSQDTGYHLYRQYGQNRQERSECVTPVYRPDCDYPVQWPRVLSRLLDKLLPDHLSHLPKQPGYYTRSGFRELGYADATAYGWEEFAWRGDPFGFHVRGYQRGNRDPEWEMATLLHVITSLTGMEALPTEA